MSDVAALIADMVRAGVDPELIGRTAQVLSEREPVRITDEQAERRRAKDRERKRLRNSAESAETEVAKERPQTPKETNPSPKEKTPKGVQKKRPSRLPADWSLPDEFRQEAILLGLPGARVDAEAVRMRDWSLSSKNGAKLDWLATWRNWVREAVARLPASRASPPQTSKPEHPANAARRRLEALQNGQTDSRTSDDYQSATRLISGGRTW